MAIATGSSIEAVLTLNAKNFHDGLTSSLEAVDKFKTTFSNSIKPLASDLSKLEDSLKFLGNTLTVASKEINQFSVNAKSLSQFRTYAEAINKLANALKILSSDTINAERAINIINNMFKQFRDVLSNTEVKLKGTITSVEQLSSAQRQGISSMVQYKKGATDVMTALEMYDARMMSLKNNFKNPFDTGKSLAQSTAIIEQNSNAMRQNGAEILRNMGYRGKLTVEEERNSVATDKHSQSAQRNVNAMNRQATASRGLGKALSSLRMIGSMVVSMFAYNFAHKLMMATSETVHAKSEMEGYFKMLHFSQGEISQFNKKLDETVGQFQRINKYSLGETISSIGVEFNLTTQEMEKAMPVVSMITSEYLRAGRNANEASLAVKDILQGEFQRLSRETGVKGDQLKEAGWSGDKNDVMGLLEALDKVGKSRNWDTFVVKANSLNDIITILQNRFGEWSADMVNVVQPSIVGAFNSMMSFGQGLSASLSGLWKWLNGSSWGALATKVAMVSGAVLTLAPALLSVRSGANMLQVANMSLGQSLSALVFGMNAEALATQGATDSIAMNVLGIKAQQLEDTTLVGVINGMIASRNAETIATDLGTASNLGFTGGLYAMITGEEIAEGTTIGLSGALGLLAGAFLTSPIGWFTLALLGLASAFYVVTGGLSDTWDKMKQFKEAMQNTEETMKPHVEYLNKLKDKVGETSEKYIKARDSVKEFYHELQSSHKAYNDAETDYENIGIALKTNFNDVLEKNGIPKEKAKEYSANFDYLTLGKSKYVKADEVLNQQVLDENSKFSKDLDDLTKKVGGDSKLFGEYSEKLQGNYANLAEHSYIANTSDDWWEWMWNSLYVGFDRFWINWDKFWVDTIKQFSDFDIMGLLFGENSQVRQELENAGKWLSDSLSGISKWVTDGLSNAWKWITDGLDNWEVDAKKFLEPLNKFGDEVNKFLENPLGYLHINEHIDNVWKEMIDPLIKGITEDLPKYINDSINRFKELLPKIDLNSIINWLLPDPVSTEDGSEHLSVQEEMYQVIVQPIMDWVNNFNSDPLGTLGVQLPQIDLIGLITSLIPIGGEGGFDIGGWLSSLFDLSGIVSSFTTNLNTIFTTASNIAMSVSGVFQALKDAIWSHITNLVNNVKNGFENAKSYAVSKITAMRDSVSGVIHQMTDAWKQMKDSILNSAKLIYDGVKKKFDDVKNTLSDFFSKLQDPSKWGSAGQRSMSQSPKPRTVRKLFGGFAPSPKSGAGINPYNSPNQKVKLQDLVQAVGGNKQVTLSDFLSMFSEGGFGSWSFHEPAKKQIFNTGKQWKSGSPVIKGIGSVGDGYKVERFWDGKPKFAWQEFMEVAEAIFSQIPYKFYYDSDWKGSWLGALLSGALNCSDGAEALIALASVFGFTGGTKVHTTTKDGTGHFFARINGHNLDTTHFQNSGSWSPLGGAGTGGGRVSNRTVNVNVEVSGTVYGVDDLDSKIQESVQKGIQAEFNDPYTIAI